MKKAIKIPAFYKALGKEACNTYLRRIESASRFLTNARAPLRQAFADPRAF